MKTLYIHIGDAKTGSSTIQKYCSDNRAELLKSGIDYIPLGLLARNGIAQHKFAFLVNKNRSDYNLNLSSIFEDLNSYISSSKLNNFIISSEGFCSLRSHEEIMTLKNRLPKEINIKIIIYLRNPCDWIESWYCQVVKSPPFTKATFNEFYERHQSPAYDVALKYSEVFSKENMIVKPFLRTKFIDGNLISDFFYALNTKIKKPNQNVSTNISPSIGCIKTLRLLNEKLDLPDHLRTKIYNDIVKYLPKETKQHFIEEKNKQKVFKKYTPIIQRIENEIVGKNGYLKDLYE